MADKRALIILEAQDRASAVIEKVANAMEKVSEKTKSVGDKMADFGKKLDVMGRNMQRTGRVLSIQLTAPLVAFGKAAVDEAVKADTAWRRVQKVFSGTAEVMRAELMPAAKELALAWGQSQLEIANVMEEFAAMGFKTKAIIEATTKAVEISKLGNLDLAQSQALVTTLMQTFNLQGEKLTQTIANLNAVEDESAARFDDLAFGAGRFGSVMQTANVPIERQAALLGVLQANQDRVSINSRALRTITKRLLAPTENIQEALDKYNITTQKLIPITGEHTKVVGRNEKQLKKIQSRIESVNFQISQYENKAKGANLADEERKEKIEDLRASLAGLNSMQAAASGETVKYQGTIMQATGELKPFDNVLLEIAEHWKEMTDAEKANFATTVAGTHFFNQFMVLMDDMSSEQSEWNRIIGETSDEQENMNRMMNQLGIESESAAVQFGRLNEKFRLFKEFVGRDIIPIILPMLEKLGELGDKFMALDEQTRKNIVKFGMLLITIGPLLIFFGMLFQAIGTILYAGGKLLLLLKFLALTGIPAVGKALLFLVTNPIGLFILAILAGIAVGILIINNWDKIKAKADELIQKIKDLWQSFRDKFNEMGGIVGAVGNAIMDHIENKYIKPIKTIIEWVGKAIKALRNLASQTIGGGGGGGTFGGAGQHGLIVPGSVGAPVPILAHGGERIVPRGSNIQAPFAGGGGGGGVTINMTGPIVMDSEERTRQLADRIIKIIGRDNELSRYGVGF